VRVAEELGITPEIILYQKTPPDREALSWLVDHIEDPPTNLVRRDSQFTKLGLTEADVESDEQIIELLLKRKMLLQRPIVVRGERAIIGRPKERVRAFLSD
jgi:arsenate reductase